MKKNPKQYSLTGGVLNVINEKYHCNSKNNSVAIMQLIRYHKPRQKDELVALIESHSAGKKHSNCTCGARSKGTIKDFGMNLYKANLDFFKNEPHKAKTGEECEMFMYHLFITQSLKGELQEHRALSALALKMPTAIIEIATEEQDFGMGVDLIVKNNTKEVGIQVKPVSYRDIPASHPVKQINIEKNKRFKKPVHYLYYNLQGEFINTDEIILKIKK